MKAAPVKINRDIVTAHGLTDEEYDRIVAVLSREPNITELGIFSVMWSEHCSYKNSRPILKLLPTTGEKVLVKAGEENAGCVDIGDGLAVVFKIESHNHPSAVEPFQGAATGVGGILRDIFTMGARPIASMNSLRFGDLSNTQVRRLLEGVVGGIAHYGNCMGIPTIGGEVYFDSAYEGNPLVNAMSLGILRHEELVRGQARGVGNTVYYLGATTGRDGLGGASFASRELTEESAEDRPAVQVGDPFMEKLLLEACLELMQSGAVVGIQDMGAAGLTCSTCETAARGNAGIEIDIAKVPRRETGMSPYEVMLSESQERMLVIVKRGREKEVEQIFEKWDLHAVAIGRVTEGHLMRVFEGEQLVAEIPTKALTTDAPVYEREEVEPAYLAKARRFDLAALPDACDWNQVALALLGHPTIASKQWIFRQYDYMVRTDTILPPGHDAAVIRIKGSRKALAMSTDGNGLYSYLDPYEGGKIAVAEAARNVVCTGARPLALTNCLNFGNPMKPEIFWQFHRCVEGMRDAAQAFNTPVTGGNVSFYNENPARAIYPTPTIGMVGILEDVDQLLPSTFQREGDLIFLLGETLNEVGGSQYLLIHHGERAGRAPHLDLEREVLLHEVIQAANRNHFLHSCHDLSEGGLVVALAESCLRQHQSSLGCRVSVTEHLRNHDVRKDALLFGESQSRVIVSVPEQHTQAFQELVHKSGLPHTALGRVGGDRLQVDDFIDLSLTDVQTTYEGALTRYV